MNCCTACKQSFDRVPRAPILRDAVWAKLADTHELLCTECCLERTKTRRVHLTLADLRPCPFNLFHRPYSWFDLFAEGEPLADIDAWLEAAARGGDASDQEHKMPLWGNR